MQELSLQCGGGRNFGRGHRVGRIRYYQECTLVLCPVHFVMHNNKIHKIQNERFLCEQCYEVTAQQSVAAKNVSVNAAPGGVHPTQEPGKLGIY